YKNQVQPMSFTFSSDHGNADELLTHTDSVVLYVVALLKSRHCMLPQHTSYFPIILTPVGENMHRHKH
uniref:hypothetical protein n=1 Tax=Escherichia coli TaxID=562 RepID=UPI003B20E8B0